MKDNFSTQSNDYARFRPQYPQKLIDYLISLTGGQENCWDCGTGNGQFAVQLADRFQRVLASDISEKQLKNATLKSNIEYSLQSAEKTNFPDHHFDLVTVAQAAHWFDFQRFNLEVKRVLKPDGVIALFGYGLVKVDGKIGEMIKDFYWNVTKPFWDPERNHIVEEYKTIPFPFNEIEVTQNFDIKNEMSLEELTGYIGTWSAVQHFKKANGYHPVDKLLDDLSKIWSEGKRTVTFPVFIRVGRV
ncbi:MAG: class I SAM-dependent methyltransferase [Ekhidna sp.]